MKSNYKKIGDHIRLVDERNAGHKVKTLLGLSISKQFIPSVANIIGTDMENYKIIRKNQFACSTMQVRRDKKMPVALLQEVDEAMISQAYPIFEITDTTKLLPEYLMMWFTRQEFDREACFYAIGGVRGSLEWEDFCEMSLPIPKPDKQKEIVKEYHSIVNSIVLNNQLIQKLEETAQAIYKQWFVDFEFPNEEDKPYKSSGGEMEESELGEIPKGWRVGELGEIIALFDSKRIPLADSERRDMKKIYPYYGAASLMDYVEEFIFEGTYVLLGEDGSVITPNGNPILQFVWGRFWVNNHAHIIQGKNGFDTNTIYILLKNTNVTEIITGGVQAKISQTNLNSVPVIIPNKKSIEELNYTLKPIFYYRKWTVECNNISNKLLDILLSKLATIEN